MTGILVHDFPDSVPSWPMARGEPYPHFDAMLMRRLADSLALAKPRNEQADIWTPIVALQEDVISQLLSGKYREVAEILSQPFASTLTYGFEQFGNANIDPQHQPALLDWMRRHAVDKLLSLAEALRAIPLQNPEQGNFTPWFQESPDALLARIEAAAKIKIESPRYLGGLFGLSTLRGVLSERIISALYAALRIRDLVPDVSAPICEIGGGAGYVAYWCERMGYGDYTIVDLPSVSLVQGYLLATNLGTDHVTLPGEPAVPGCIRLMGEFDTRKYALVLNVDSLPEINGTAARDYVARIRAQSDLFLSINQEAWSPRSEGQHQERVGDLIDEIGGFRRLSRTPCWLRRGYVEEVYASV